jgi:hypothetical protein
MSPTKVLNINPDFFSSKSGGNSKTMKKERKRKPNESKTANSMRKDLLAKIRDYQKREGEKINEKNKQEVVEKDPSFESEFNKSLNFLQEISNKNKEKKKNKSFKRPTVPPSSEQFVNIDLPEALIDIPQIYHNERNSTENIPVLINQVANNQNHQTIGLNTNTFNPQIQNNIPQPTTLDDTVNFKPLIKPVQTHTPEIIINTEPLQNEENIKLEIKDINEIKNPNPITNLREKVKANIKNSLHKSKHKLSSTTITQNRPVLTNNHNLTLKIPPPYSNLKGGNKPTFREWNKTYKTQPTVSINENKSTVRTMPSKKLITRKTKTIKYNLGKKGKNINVLIKNNNTRKKIRQEILSLRKKPILEVKEYLHDKNLIKSGTLAPNDVLREIYEQSILSGDLVNENKQNLIHNFLSSKPETF